MREIFLLFIIIFSTNLIFGNSKYRVAYIEGGSIKIVDINGNLQEEIRLPRKIGNFSFSKDMKMIAYDEDREEGKRDIYLYNLVDRTERRITKGPYIYPKKEKWSGGETYWGEERYFSPALSPNGEYVAFDIAPEFLITKENGVTVEKYYGFEDLNDLYEIGIIEVQTGKFLRVTNNDHLDTSPSWSPEGGKIVFSSDSQVGIYDLKKKILKYFSHGFLLASPIQWLNNSDILIELYNDEIKLIKYNIETSQTQIFIDLLKLAKELKIDDEIFRRGFISSISAKKDFILIVADEQWKLRDEQEIFILDISKKVLKKLIKTKTKDPRPIFLD